MRVHYLQHVPFEGLGSIADWLESKGARVSRTPLYEGAPLPGPDEFDWLIALGGPMSVNDVATLPWIEAEKELIAEAVAADRTVLGICFGAQLLASALGCEVYQNRAAEIGWFPVHPADGASEADLGAPFREPLQVFHWHGETFDLPPGATHLARSEACEHQAFAIGGRVLGLQFHLEMRKEGAEALIEACRHELRPGDWIHSEREILEDERRFEDINGVMDDVLELLPLGRAATS